MPRFRRPPERLRGMSFYGLIHCVQPYKRNWYFLEAARWSGRGNLGVCAEETGVEQSTLNEVEPGAGSGLVGTLFAKLVPFLVCGIQVLCTAIFGTTKSFAPPPAGERGCSVRQSWAFSRGR